MSDKLIQQVKDKCNITWEDADTNRRVEQIIRSAIPDLKHRLGITDKDFDFAADGAENTLFLAYCLYEYNHALNEFEDNYAKTIAQVRQRYEVAQYLESEGAESE